MPLSLNDVKIAGTLTRAAEVTYTPKGTAVANFSLAVNRVWRDEGGTKHEEAEFIDFEAWGKTAEIIEEYTDKGHTILVEGRLKTDRWEDKTTGQKRSRVKVVVEKFHFVSTPKDRGGRGEDEPPPARRQATPPARQAAPPPARKQHDPDLDAPADDDIPF